MVIQIQITFRYRNYWFCVTRSDADCGCCTLRSKLAEVIGIPVTNAWTPSLNPLLARPIHASDLANLVELDLELQLFDLVKADAGEI